MEKGIVERFLELKDMPRVEALKIILNENKISFEELNCQQGCTNILVRLTDARQYVLLVAHYDVYPGSLGINDNTLSVANLISLAIDSKGQEQKRPFNILFTDKEETGMVGSYSYAKQYKKEIVGAIVLDIIGYGDELVYGTHTPETFSFFNEYDIKRITQVLPSDNLSFQSNNIRNVLITAAHSEDLVDFAGLEYILKSKPRFYESFHNRSKDNDINVINFELPKKLRKVLKSIFL